MINSSTSRSVTQTITFSLHLLSFSRLFFCVFRRFSKFIVFQPKIPTVPKRMNTLKQKTHLTPWFFLFFVGPKHQLQPPKKVVGRPQSLEIARRSQSWDFEVANLGGQLRSSKWMKKPKKNIPQKRGTLQGTNISHPWEKEHHLQNAIFGGYVSFAGGYILLLGSWI